MAKVHGRMWMWLEWNLNEDCSRHEFQTCAYNAIKLEKNILICLRRIIRSEMQHNVFPFRAYMDYPVQHGPRVYR